MRQSATLGLSEPPAGLERFVAERDFSPFGGLEAGVAGLCNALSVVGCVTAASCRTHATPPSWSDCPVVFFAAPTWRVELLAELISAEGCGLEDERGMLKIYAPSVREMHGLAQRLLTERARFRRMPDHWRTRRSRSSTSTGTQLGLLPRDR